MIYICLSVYNGTLFLQEQLMSLENQNFDHRQITLLTRDDGSNDESFQLLHDFASKSSLTVSILHDRTNYGIKKSFEILMNTALQMGANYIMFCDQDDIWYENKISKTFQKMLVTENQYPSLPILIHTDLTVVDEQMHPINSSFWKYQNIDPSKNALHNFITDNNITGCSMMINHILAKQIQVIPEKAIMHDWWIGMYASAFGRIIYLDEPLIFYRQHNNNDTGAQQYGWNYWVTRFLRNPSFARYIIQVELFLKIYKDQFTPMQRKMLEGISMINHMNWFQRRLILFKYKIFKNGFIRNLGLVFFI